MTHPFRVCLPAWMSSKSLLTLPMPGMCLPLRPPYNMWDSKIERRPGGGLTISNPKGVDALLRAHGLADANSAKMPYKVTADLTAAKDNDVLVPVRSYQELIGSLSFICDTTHQTTSWIVGVLGHHMHCPTAGHMAASKMVLLKGARECGTTLKHTGPIQVAAYYVAVTRDSCVIWYDEISKRRNTAGQTCAADTYRPRRHVPLSPRSSCYMVPRGDYRPGGT
jgi:hypothetical protein